MSSYVGAMAFEGTLLLGHLPSDTADDLRTVVYAAAGAKTKLAAGDPAASAIAPLVTDKVSAARKAVVAYRGYC